MIIIIIYIPSLAPECFYTCFHVYLLWAMISIQFNWPQQSKLAAGLIVMISTKAIEQRQLQVLKVVETWQVV